MPLFQPSVLKHYLKLQDSEAINKAYTKYKRYFLNPTIQDNIRSSKEEEYQGIFLTELFVNVLDYTLKPKANFNLVAEYKNQNNARKADGAILDNDIAIGVIELKGTNTKDLESIRKQAFDYKANQKGCVYVITSNFEKLRFYINDATEFEEFNLFELTPERFELLYICLQKDNVLNNTPLKIKEQSVVEEEQITKQFYKDYSLFKRELFRDLVKRNAKTLKNEASLRASAKQSHQLTEEEKAELVKLEKNVKLTLFKKSQKLIDRYLFIFFAEDRGLLPPNSTQQILDKWKADVDFGDDRPLYVLFKQYFNFLDTGRAGTTKRAEIYAYNGGLFKEDKTLDSLDIDSDLLYKHTSKLAAYDFESQVDVNILGHIFENSLNEIESVNAEIEGADFDKQKSKRKKDGVFYTPKYITKYIVENTVGKLCEEKKTELGFKEEEYFKGRKNRQKATITKLVNILDTYRDWLLQLTICDPACGSGAFLNQALNFLIAEHQYIDELKTKVLGGGLQFPDIENTILENNIYGVDLNEESVEIAKLSLWLRTAQPRRKLNDLSSNIKCGNSLIDSKSVAGDKAFNWQEQFPKVFEKGGFDVIIGNPPYGAKIDAKQIEYFRKRYNTVIGHSEVYYLFTEKSLNELISKNGYLGFIIPNAWLSNKYAMSLRQCLLQKNIETLINFNKKIIFEDANVETSIVVIRNKDYENTVDVGQNLNELYEFNQTDWINSNNYIMSFAPNKTIDKVIKKLQQAKLVFSDILDISNGIKPYQAGYGINLIGNVLSKEDVKNKIYHSFVKIDENYKRELKGKGVKRYQLEWEESYIKWGKWLMSPKSEHYFEQPKILIRQITGEYFFAALDKDKYYADQSLYICTHYENNQEYPLEFFLGLINSRLYGFYFRKFYSEEDDLFPKIKVNELKSLPVTIPDTNKITELSLKVNSITKLYKDLNQIIKKKQDFLSHTFILQKLSKKLQNWHELEFGDFIKELNKAIKANNKLRVKDGLDEVPTLTKKDEFEWLDLFEDNKQKAQALQTQINQTDKEIDAMVYQLYGLTEEEISIVENS